MTKEEREFEEWEYKHYGPMGLIESYVIAKKAYLAGRQKGEEEREIQVSYAINSEGKLDKNRSYCFHCGTSVRDQKFCHGCGYKLLWKEASHEQGD